MSSRGKIRSAKQASNKLSWKSKMFEINSKFLYNYTMYMYQDIRLITESHKAAAAAVVAPAS